MHAIQLTTRLILEPRQAFRDLRDRPTFLAPLIALVLGLLATSLTYFHAVDFPWLVDTILNSDPATRHLPEDQRAKAAEMFSLQGMAILSTLGILVGFPLLRFLEAGYYRFTVRRTADGLGYRHWLALACWSTLPVLLTVPFMFVALGGHPNGQIMMEQLQLASFNELVVHAAPDGRWYKFATSLNLLQPWCWWLTACGIREWTGRSWTYSAAVALGPIVAIFGGWAAWLMIAR